MRRQLSAGVALLLVVVVLCGSMGSVQPLVSGKWFDRIIIFVFENSAYDFVTANPDFAHFDTLGTTLVFLFFFIFLFYLLLVSQTHHRYSLYKLFWSYASFAA